jgi:hypothetical protein
VERYHLNEWMEGHKPNTPQLFFNMKHYLARNVIERCFGLLKGRWAILRTKSFYPVKIQCRIITACCLLHNHIRREMPTNPLENELSEVTSVQGLNLLFVMLSLLIFGVLGKMVLQGNVQQMEES